MAYLNSKDVFLEAVRTGTYFGKACVDYSIYGLNLDVDTGGAEDVWLQGGLFVPPTTNRIHDIVSTDANDDGSPADTGARSVKVYGVTASGLETETIVMNGITNVATTKSYYDIYKMEVVTAGSSNANEGTITATAQTDGTVTNSILTTSYNASARCAVFIPTGYTGYLFSIESSMQQATATSFADLWLLQKYSGGVWTGRQVMTLNNSGNSLESHTFKLPYVLAADNWYKIQVASVTNNNTVIQSSMQILLVQD